MKHILLIAFICILTGNAIAADRHAKLASLLNQERSNNNQKPLVENAELSKAAQLHAQDMLSNDYLSHTGQDGSNFFQRIKRQNYRPCYAAENIAKGQSSAEQVMRDWMNSKTHRKNNLSAKPDHFGIGVAGNTWVILFGRKC